MLVLNVAIYFLVSVNNGNMHIKFCISGKHFVVLASIMKIFVKNIKMKKGSFVLTWLILAGCDRRAEAEVN